MSSKNNERSISHENHEAFFKANSELVQFVAYNSILYCFSKTMETIYKSVIMTEVVHN